MLASVTAVAGPEGAGVDVQRAGRRRGRQGCRRPRRERRQRAERGRCREPRRRAAQPDTADASGRAPRSHPAEGPRCLIRPDRLLARQSTSPFRPEANSLRQCEYAAPGPGKPAAAPPLAVRPRGRVRTGFSRRARRRRRHASSRGRAASGSRLNRGSVPAPTPAPTATPIASGSVPIVPVVDFRSPPTSVSRARIAAILAGTDKRYKQLELVERDAPGILAALHLGQGRGARPPRARLLGPRRWQPTSPPGTSRLGILRASEVGPAVRALALGRAVPVRRGPGPQPGGLAPDRRPGRGRREVRSRADVDDRRRRRRDARPRRLPGGEARRQGRGLPVRRGDRHDHGSVLLLDDGLDPAARAARRHVAARSGASSRAPTWRS